MLVSKVELKVDAEVEEDDDDDDEACCKIRVRASNRLVKCTVVAAIIEKEVSSSLVLQPISSPPKMNKDEDDEDATGLTSKPSHRAHPQRSATASD